VPDGVYDRGKSRTNRIEAFAVAAEAKRRMLHWLDLPKENRPTLGVITFNAQQQSLIQDLLDDARRDNPDLEWFFADEKRSIGRRSGAIRRRRRIAAPARGGRGGARRRS
jgi:hypothetical protein